MRMRVQIAIAALLLAACSVGTGRGSVSGAVRDDACMIAEPEYELGPTFFSADVVEDRGAPEGTRRAYLTIRIQRGSFREGDSDGLMIAVRDANLIGASMIGVPIPVSADSDALVQMTLYLNQTCDAGFPRDFWQVPGVLEAQAGTITFTSIYAPDVSGEMTEIAATFVATFADPGRDDRFADLSGDFAFQYQRGRPAQYFP